jgi:hypothetical protein
MPENDYPSPVIHFNKVTIPRDVKTKGGALARHIPVFHQRLNLIDEQPQCSLEHALNRRVVQEGFGCLLIAGCLTLKEPERNQVSRGGVRKRGRGLFIITF